MTVIPISKGVVVIFMSEKNIWKRLKSGDQKALEEIYRTYFSDLYSYGKKFTKDENTVEDCIQEMFVDLWNRREGLSDTDAIRPYLYVSLRRRIFQTIKKNRKSTDTELQESHFDAELAIDQIIVDKEIRNERSENLKVAFAKLSDRQKEILYLKFYSEMDYGSISEIMDMNYQSARNLVSRAILKLSKNMISILTILFCF